MPRGFLDDDDKQSSGDTVDIEVEMLRETSEHFIVTSDEVDGKDIVLPRRLCKYTPDDPDAVAGTGTMSIPRWLAEKTGFA